MAFATVADLAARRGDLADEARAAALLEDATALMAKTMRDAGVEVDEADEVQVALLRSVCCTVAGRCLDAGSVAYTQSTQTAGPFSASYTLANPMGDVYLTASERRALGAGRGRAVYAHPLRG